jgi:uncharacterized membrane protein YozB (DUF420 family)
MSQALAGVVAPVRARAGDRFFSLMTGAAAAVVLAGFSNSYFLWPLTRATRHAGGQPIAASLPLAVHLHVIVFSAWMVLLVAQSSLVAAGRVAVHRRLGMAAAGLIPLMFGLGLYTAVLGARRGWNPGGPYPDALGFLIVGIVDIAVFAVLASAAVVCRRRTEVHKRLMLYATLGGLMWPAITRIPGIGGKVPAMFALLVLLLAAPAVRDFAVRARLRWMTFTLALCALATFPLRTIVGNTAAWRQFASWLIG